MHINRWQLAVGLGTVLIAGLLAPTAAGDDKVTLGGGAGIVLNGNPCTLAAIGHDRAGELVGFTSAHCGVSGPR